MSTMKIRYDEAAASLRAVYGGTPPIAPLRDTLGTNDLAAAYTIQEINTQYWLHAGRRLIGRKVGATSAAVQQMLGFDEPDYGMLFADTAYADGDTIPMSRLQQPKAEGEIAFYLADDLDGPDLTIADVLHAVEYAVAAIEIISSRIRDWNIKILDTIADNASTGVFVLGTQPRTLGEFDPVLCGMVQEKNGIPSSIGAGVACLGNPLTATLWLARKMLDVGRPLKKGDLVLSGALGPLVTITSGDRLDLHMTGFGRVRAQFSDSDVDSGQQEKTA